MSLFDNRQVVNLRACEQMVELVLAEMGIDVQSSRRPEHKPIDREARRGPTQPRASEDVGTAVIDREARSAAVIDREARSAAVIDREARSAAAWGLTCGSAHLYVYLTSAPTSEENYIHVVAPIFQPPADASATLWRRLLELNGKILIGAAFGLRDGEVVVATDRSTLGLDRNEVEEMIRRIGDYADLYDDALTREFGGVRHCDLPASAPA